ncbi:hypothetical protein [Shinella zoogloeoides]
MTSTFEVLQDDEFHRSPEDIIVTAGEVCTDLGISSSVQNCMPIIKALIEERQRNQWQDISTAPEHERVMVAGWNNATKRVQGYWWWHEDVVVDGKAFEHPEATHWFPIVLPAFPAAPEGGA